ncbi:hypothetical protein RUM43_007415 [Polyplax serrata]|uniref:DNA/RNA non-specific endonuclease/pyrophosphatase/phosphodiesterase domain-containing protein n=1 Tax=Polyplax serrata TaxID=468196 RepID=A0AAN8P5N0_POLSC
MWTLTVFFGFLLVPAGVLGKQECRTQLDTTVRSSKIFIDVFKFSQPKRSKEVNSGGDLVNFECGNGFVRKDLPGKSYPFQCVNGKFNRTYPLEEILCRSDYHKSSMAVRLSPIEIRSKIFKCDGPGLELYQLNSVQPDGKTKHLYTACLDTAVMRPKFVFQPSTEEKPPKGIHLEERNDVWGFDGYGSSINEMLVLSKGYVENIQRNRTTNSFPQKYSAKNPYPHYFNRGHLAPYADYADALDRKTTCEYINAAPQWEAFNKNSWSLVEREARMMRQTNPKEWEVYTGTYGSIPTTRGPLVVAPIFEQGRFKKGMLPVPMLYWKLVYNTVDKTKSKAFVGVNNPEFKTSAEIGPKYKICTPIAQKNKDPYEGSEFFGFVYQCKVDEFLNALKNNEKIVKEKFVF